MAAATVVNKEQAGGGVEHLVAQEQRAKALNWWRASHQKVNFRGCTIWLTGPPGSGKTTLATALERFLVSHGFPTYKLDNRNVGSGLNANISPNDQLETIRRAAEVAKLFADSGQICVASFDTPLASDRELARKIHEQNKIRFYEIYLTTPPDECQKRTANQPKTLGKIFSGIFEPPVKPELQFSTRGASISDCVQRVVEFLANADIVPATMLDTVPELFVKSPTKPKH